jgi:hypothetical protein
MAVLAKAKQAKPRGRKTVKRAGLARRRVEDWAIELLRESGAISRCPHHGYRKDAGHPEAWRRARAMATAHPFPNATAKQSLAAIDELADAIGDACPEC